MYNTGMTGVDIVDISRVELRDSFIHYILTEEELAEFETKHTDRQKKEYAAGRFAAKEAIFKATQDRNYLKYSILHEKSGKPYVKDHPEIEISISHDGGIAIAMVCIPH